MRDEPVGTPQEVRHIWETIYGALPKRRVAEFHWHEAVSQLMKMPCDIVEQAFRQARQPADAARVAGRLASQRGATRSTKSSPVGAPAKRKSVSTARSSGRTVRSSGVSLTLNSPPAPYGTISKQGY